MTSPLQFSTSAEGWHGLAQPGRECAAASRQDSALSDLRMNSRETSHGLTCRSDRATRGILAVLVIVGLVGGVRTGAVRGDSAAEQEGTAHGLAAVAIYPPRINLDDQRDVQRIAVLGTYQGGEMRDLTPVAALTLGDPGVGQYKDGRLYPARDGATELLAAVGGVSAVAPVVVKNAGGPRPISFRNDVMPVFMEAGCNNGACHGSAQGQQGFRLSLFGFEPEKDYVSLTRDLGGRRIDWAGPQRSLMLRKPLEQVSHGGGQRITIDGELHRTLSEWIAARTPDDRPDAAALVGIEVMPTAAVLRGRDRRLPLLVTARYSDGADRDVTSLALFDSSDATTVAVDAGGVVTSGLKGEAHVMVRYGSFAAISQFIVLEEATAFAWDGGATANYIDEAINEKLRKLQVNPSPICSDEAFVRRAHLDIVGLLPTVEECRAFLSDSGAGKRGRLIDALLERPEFPELWAMKWAELLRIESGSRRISHKAMYLYNSWLRDAILAGRPMDELVRELLSAEGGNFANPAANFYLVETSPTQMAENVAQVFCGIRIQCAQCHNHPFERWTQDDYYGFAAFFSQIGRKQTDDEREWVIYNSGGGEVQHPRTGQNAAPKLLGGAVPQSFREGDRRKELAAWLTSPDNPYFAASFVDRVWAHFMGRGLVDPPDDVRVSNPPSHPALRERLAREFIASKYDLRALLRTICNSNAYQRASQTNATNERDNRNFSHAATRRLSAETLLDVICQVTETPEKFSGLPLGARSVQIADAGSGSYFLDVFGRPARLSACTCERRDEPTLSQALHLINGATIQSKITAAGGRLARLLAAGKPPREIVEDLYVAALCRRATEEEMGALVASIEAAADARAGLEDVYWAVLNSKEFVFNH